MIIINCSFCRRELYGRNRRKRRYVYFPCLFTIMVDVARSGFFIQMPQFSTFHKNYNFEFQFSSGSESLNDCLVEPLISKHRANQSETLNQSWIRVAFSLKTSLKIYELVAYTIFFPEEHSQRFGITLTCSLSISEGVEVQVQLVRKNLLLHGLYKMGSKLLLCENQCSVSISSKERKTRTNHEFNLLLQTKLKNVV